MPMLLSFVYSLDKLLLDSGSRYPNKTVQSAHQADPLAVLDETPDVNEDAEAE
jgi:hypothetical protein